MQALHYCTCGVRQLALKAPPCPLQAQQWVVNSTGGRDGEPVCHQAAGQAPPAGAACILPPACRCLRAAAVAACFSSSHSLCLLTQPRTAVLNLVMPSSWTCPAGSAPPGHWRRICQALCMACAPPPHNLPTHPWAHPALPADILLSWDYWELERKMSEGGGPISELPTIPKQFCSVEVRQPLARRPRVLLGTRVRACLDLATGSQLCLPALCSAGVCAGL